MTQKKVLWCGEAGRAVRNFIFVSSGPVLWVWELWW